MCPPLGIEIRLQDVTDNITWKQENYTDRISQGTVRIRMFRSYNFKKIYFIPRNLEKDMHLAHSKLLIDMIDTFKKEIPTGTF